MDKLYPRYFPLIEVGDGIRMAMIPTDDAKVIRTTCKYYLSESPLHTYRLIANGGDDGDKARDLRLRAMQFQRFE